MEQPKFNYFIEDEETSALYMVYHRMIELNNPEIPFVLEDKEDHFLLNGKYHIISPDDAQQVKLNPDDFTSYLIQKITEKENLTLKNEEKGNVATT